MGDRGGEVEREGEDGERGVETEGKRVAECRWSVVDAVRWPLAVS